MRLFFSVGEPSGDLHGANLIRQLRLQRDDLELVGYGGPNMARAGCQLHADLTQLAVMWLTRAILNLHKFWNLVSRADRYFRHHRPDAVILIDYPGFNWWIARRAKAHGIPVFYYGTPQIWAWASWRVAKMRRLVDHVLCKLPFEPHWYAQRDCQATFVGHPYFDEVQRHPMDEPFLAEQRRDQRRLVAILPGSRTQEVKLNLPDLIQAARTVHSQAPEVRFAVAAFRPHHAEMAREMIAAARLPDNLSIDVEVQRTPELIQHSVCTMAVSGSVSLELLHHEKPTVVLYRISRFANVMQHLLRKVQYITLVNLLMFDELPPKESRNYDPRRPGAEQVLFPEYLTCEDRSADVAYHLVEWLGDEQQRLDRVAQLGELKRRVAGGGASQRGASYILQALDAVRQTQPPGPHFPVAKTPTPFSASGAVRLPVSTGVPFDPTPAS